jgi:hypothetical protein
MGSTRLAALFGKRRADLVARAEPACGRQQSGRVRQVG